MSPHGQNCTYRPRHTYISLCNITFLDMDVTGDVCLRSTTHQLEHITNKANWPLRVTYSSLLYFLFPVPRMHFISTLVLFCLRCMLYFRRHRDGWKDRNSEVFPFLSWNTLMSETKFKNPDPPFCMEDYAIDDSFYLHAIIQSHEPSTKLIPILPSSQAPRVVRVKLSSFPLEHIRRSVRW